jgi:hypothetical protein
MDEKEIEVDIVEIFVGLLQGLQHLGIPWNMTNALGMYLITRVIRYQLSQLIDLGLVLTR